MTLQYTTIENDPTIMKKETLSAGFTTNDMNLFEALDKEELSK